MRKIKTALLGVILALGLTGCAFNRDFKEALKKPVSPGDITGAWEGTWKSDSNGHNGRLRCILTKTSEENYQARYRANYKKILSFEYTVPLTAARDGSSYRFEGSADLGKLAGGVYTYKGAASAGTFISTYDSKYDHGTFEMSRPLP